MRKRQLKVDFLVHNKKRTAKILHIFAIITLMTNTVLAGLVFVPVGGQAVAGSPAPYPDCLCDGKVNYLKLKYIGQEEAKIKVITRPTKDVIFFDYVSSGAYFELFGQDRQGTLGAEIELYVDFKLNAKIHTSCSVELYNGMTAGDFVIIDGSSRNNGPFCEAPAVCGDNIVSGNETCDLGGQNGVVCEPSYGEECGYCTDSCQWESVAGPFCGDGVVNGDEACDAGCQNGEACTPEYGDECSYCNTDCQNETVAGPYCGDGIVNGQESCDDGNNEDGDGCDRSCRLEDNIEPGRISGYKFLDADGSGSWDDSESGLAGWTLFIDANHDNILNRNIYDYPVELYAVSAEGGFYRFINLQPGEYRVCEEMKSGFIQTYPAGQACHTVSVRSGEESQNNNFGNREIVAEPEPVCGDGRLDPGEDCDDGNNIDGDGCSAECRIEAGTLTVQKTVSGGQAQSADFTMKIYSGNELVASFPGSADGSATVLADGIYRIEESVHESYLLQYSGDCDASGQVEIRAGESKRCLLQNTYYEPPVQIGLLTVVKLVEGGPATSSDFTMHVGDNVQFPGSATATTRGYAPGDYRLSESGSYMDDYNLAYSGDCDDQGWVSVTPETAKTCVLTNTYIVTVPETFCGNGIVESGESCDAGSENGQVCPAPYGGDCGYCSETCGSVTVVGPYCGDGILSHDEECEDGNNIDGDGCSAECRTETVVSAPVCGNGIKEAGEECDGQDGLQPNFFCTKECRLAAYSSNPIFPPNRFGSSLTETLVLGDSAYPQLAIDKTAYVSQANAGDIVDYRVVITNNGSLTAFGAVLYDYLPNGLTYADTGATERAWMVGDMEPGKIYIYDYRAKIEPLAKSGRYVNVAEIKADNHGPIFDLAHVDVSGIVVPDVGHEATLPMTGFDVRELKLLLIALLCLSATAGFSSRRLGEKYRLSG